MHSINSIVLELFENQDLLANCTVKELSENSITLNSSEGWEISALELEGSIIIKINGESFKFEEIEIDDEMMLLFEILENYGLDYELNY